MRASERAAQLGLASDEEYGEWRSRLRADYRRSFKSPGRLMATILYSGALFFLFDPDALVGVTMCNRAMTNEERREYASHPAAWRRRKPGEMVEDDGERARKRRVIELEKQIAGDTRGALVLP